VLKTYTDKQNELKDAITSVTKELETAKKEHGENSTEFEKQNKTLDGLNASYAKCEERVAWFNKELNYASAAVAHANTALDKNTKYLNETDKTTGKCATSINEFGIEIKKTTEGLYNLDEKGQNAINALATALAASGVKGLIKDIANFLRDA